MWAIMRMAKMVTKSLARKSACRMYPVQKPAYYPNTRGHIEIDINKCIFCGACGKRCPTHAITVTRAQRDWSIERMKCIQCGACVECCPVKCLSFGRDYTPPSASKKVDTFHSDQPPPAAKPAKTELPS